MAVHVLEYMYGVGRTRTEDRLSATLDNAQMQPEPAPQAGRIPMFSVHVGGVVLSPFHNQLWCSFAFDAGTLRRKCRRQEMVESSCLPGCTHSSTRPDTLWCDAGASGWPCAFRPSDLREMLQLREELRARNRKPEGKYWDDGKFYDELVFDPSRFIAELPASIEAVFFLDVGEGCPEDPPMCEQYARAFTQAMQRHFGVTDAELPLLRFDPYNWDAPFSAAGDMS